MPTGQGGSDATISSSLPARHAGAHQRCLTRGIHTSRANTFLARLIPRVTMAMDFPFRTN
jgi:hypothetical protein